MHTSTTKYHSLRTRLILQLCLFTVALCVVYSLISFLLMYALEDAFIEKTIKREAEQLAASYQINGQWPTPERDTFRLYFSKQDFPNDIRHIALDEPQRKEFYGEEGRHYHVHTFEDYPSVFLIAEVSEDLLVRRLREFVIKFLIVSGLIVTLGASLIAWFIGKRTTTPLKRLADLVNGIEPEKIPHAFARNYPNNEIGILANTLEASFSRLASTLEREKSFTRDASHELRTPLAIIKNATELGRTKITDKHNTAVVLDRIHEAAEQMEKTVHALLLLAREEHTRSHKESIALMPIIERSILDNSILLKNKNVGVDVNDSCIINVDANPDMLKVVLDNLISNAFHHTEQGEVTLSFANNVLHISDTGPGIEPGIADQVTQIGIKGSQSTGFGFGLSIVRRLCDHQGWSMEVSSEKGTTISIGFIH